MRSRTASAPYDRPWAVAGKFYPASAAQLERQVDGFLDAAPDVTLTGALAGVVTPHAGYAYSGAVAAAALKALRGRHYDTVVLVGPSHYFGFDGIAVHGRGSFRTPLGAVPVDGEMCAALIGASAHIEDMPDAHAPEHDLEVQLPFLQRLLTDFRIAPVLMSDFSDANCALLADALTQAVEGRNALVLTTTDLAHYPGYEDARLSDLAMVEAMESFDPDEVRARSDAYLSSSIRNLQTAMCGLGPVVAGMTHARDTGATGLQRLLYANSGDVAGGHRDQVVGYVAAAFVDGAREDDTPARADVQTRPVSVEPTPRDGDVSEAAQRAMLHIARDAMMRHIEGRDAAELDDYRLPGDVLATLRERRGVFVTLTGGGSLRGCIGLIVSNEPLSESIPRMAAAAATEDPRFPAVTTEEAPLLEVEVSVLTRPRRVTDLETIEVGTHGLIVRQGAKQGLLLPQVATEQAWNRRQFLAYTCLKAGLDLRAFEEPATTVETFTAHAFSEADFDERGSDE